MEGWWSFGCFHKMRKVVGVKYYPLKEDCTEVTVKVFSRNQQIVFFFRKVTVIIKVNYIFCHFEGGWFCAITRGEGERNLLFVYIGDGRFRHKLFLARAQERRSQTLEAKKSLISNVTTVLFSSGRDVAVCVCVCVYAQCLLT